MKLISVNDENAISFASDIIIHGGIIVYPTDTLYGFGVDARNSSAIKKLNEIKKRETPISVIAWSLDIVRSWSDIKHADFEKAKKVLLESNTIIIPIKNNIVDDSILAKDSSLGVRIPHHNYPINLCKNLNFPITTTSVNRAGENSLNDPQLISDKFSNEIDLIIDAGKMPQSKGSSIYKLVNSKLELIR